VTAPAHAEVALFTGCVGDIAERAVLADAVKLFTAAGMTVSVPPAQGCCGALSQHGGLPQDAATLSACNQQAFAAASTVLPLATGCGAALRDLGDAAFAPKVRDLCATLAAALDAAGVRFAARPMTVGIHTACTQAQVFGARGAIHALLARVPGLTLVPLAPEIGCCGAAGTMFLTHPAQAGALRAPKLAVAAGVDVIVSANIGCTLHLARGLAAAGRAVPVLHPVSLLAAALETAPPARSAAGAQGPW
jgi:glycolate oxidase iron-sulfur subunit